MRTAAAAAQKRLGKNGPNGGGPGARRVHARLDLARLYIAGGRYADARRELGRVVAETAPSIIADWTVKDAPRAKELVESIKDKK